MDDLEIASLMRRVMTLGNWTEDAADEMWRVMRRATDDPALRAAVDTLVTTWTENGRPKPAHLNVLYRMEHDAIELRRSMFAVDSAVHVDPERGYDIAMKAYVRDCQDREIDIDVNRFHRIMGAFVGDRSRQYLEPEAKGPSRPQSRSSVLGSAAASPEGSDAPDTADHTPGT